MLEKFSIQPYLNDLEILNQTAEQIKKDFSFFGVNIFFSGNKDSAYSELFDQIYPHIKKLMDEDYEKFLSLLYRIDINEKFLSPKQLNIQPEIAKYVTDLIIKRCL